MEKLINNNQQMNQLDELQDDEIKLFVGDNHDYYIKKWKSAKNPNRKSGWNWSAFLGGLLWLGYRKMYFNVLIIICLFLVIDIIQLVIKVDLDRSVGTSIGAVIGILGNSFYFQHMNKKIAKIKASNLEKNELDEAIRKVGGTSWYGVGIVSFIFIGYLFVTMAISNIAEKFM